MGPQLSGGDFDPDAFDMRHCCAGTLTWIRTEEMTPEDRADFVRHQGEHGPANLEHDRLAVAGRPVRDTTGWREPSSWLRPAWRRYQPVGPVAVIGVTVDDAGGRTGGAEPDA